MILVLNAGSSTLKYKLFSTGGSQATSQAQETPHVIVSGMVERIGESGGPNNHSQAIELAIAHLKDTSHVEFTDLQAIGHRVVHAGDQLQAVELVSEQNRSAVIDALKATIPLAPLHNPPAIGCLETTLSLAPSVPNVLVFDTGFFQSLPREAFSYAVPPWFYEQYKIRRYGAHGTSHQFVSQQATKVLRSKGLAHSKLITLHLGNGASVAAIRDGQPIDTSMGLTPLEGLVMGTRCGDIDPAIVTFLQQHAGLSYGEVTQILNKESGLKGLCGDSDMRVIERRLSEADPVATLAFEVYCRRILKYIGSYTAILGGLDALVFTAGVGENSVRVRDYICQRLAYMGVHVDTDANQHGSVVFSSPSSAVALMTIHTDEELAICEQAMRVTRFENKC